MKIVIYAFSLLFSCIPTHAATIREMEQLVSLMRTVAEKPEGGFSIELPAHAGTVKLSYSEKNRRQPTLTIGVQGRTAVIFESNFDGKLIAVLRPDRRGKAAAKRVSELDQAVFDSVVRDLIADLTDLIALKRKQQAQSRHLPASFFVEPVLMNYRAAKLSRYEFGNKNGVARPFLREASLPAGRALPLPIKKPGPAPRNTSPLWAEDLRGGLFH